MEGTRNFVIANLVAMAGAFVAPQKRELPGVKVKVKGIMISELILPPPCHFH